MSIKSRGFFRSLLTGVAALMLLLMGSGVFGQPDPVPELEKVSIALKWTHQFQFAGYYAAIEKGFYAEEGLSVELMAPVNDNDHITKVLDGEADYGISDSGLVVDAMKGQPVVLLAQIFQHSPYALVSKRGSGILEPKDLEGKRVMLGISDADDAPIMAMLKVAGVDLDKVTFQPQSFRIDEFINDEVDALSVYIIDQPFGIKKEGVLFNTIDPRNYGIDFYGDNLYCTMREISLHPGRADRVRRATIRGWEYALENPDEIIDLILKEYPTQLSREHLEFESRMTAMMILADLCPIGDVNEVRYRNIALNYHEFGISDTKKIPESFFHESAVMIDLTPDEKAWLKENPHILVGTTSSWPPYDITTEEGAYQGINADYMELIGKRLDVEMRPVLSPTWKEVVEMGKAGAVHCIPGMSISPEPETWCEFTDPYVFNPVVGITRNEETEIKTWTDLSGKTVLAIVSTSIMNQVEQDLEDVNLVLVNDNKEGLERLAQGEGDAFIGWIGGVQYEIQQLKLTNLQMAFLMENEESRFRFGINRDYPLLASAMKKAVDSISQVEHIAIRQKWLNSAGLLSSYQPKLPELRSFNQVTFILKSLGVVFLLTVIVLASAWVYKGCPRHLNIRYTLFGISYIFTCLIIGITTCIIFLFRENSELTRVEYAAINSVERMFDEAEERYVVADPAFKDAGPVISPGGNYSKSRARTIKSVQQFFDQLKAQVRDELEEAHNRTDVIIQIIMILMLITIGFSVYVFYLLKRRIIKPLLLLGKGIKTIEDGDYKHAIDMDSPDEVGDLARAFNRMTGNIRENYSKLESIIEATSDGILVLDIKGNVSSYNQQFLEAGGFTSEEMENIPDVKSMYGWLNENMINASEIIEASTHGLREMNTRWHVTAFSKAGRIIELYSLPQWHGDTVIGRVVSVRDVTDSRKIEDQLLKLSQALEQSPTAVGITDLDGKIEYVNPAFTELTGNSSEELLGLNVRSLFDKELYAQDTFKQVWQTLNSGEFHRGEFKSRRKNGVSFWESVLFAPIRQADGNVSHYVVVRMDISVARKQQEALDLQNKRFRTLYEIVSNKNLSQEEILRSIIRAICRTFDMECAYIGEVIGKIRTVRYVYPQSGEVQPGHSLDLSMACCGLVALKQEPLLINDISLTHYKDSYCFQTLGINAYAGTYLRTSRGNYGVLSMFRKTPREKAFTDQDRDFLLMVGELIDASLDRLFSNKEMVERTNDLASMNEAMVDRELRMIELKKEVNELSVRLGNVPAYELTWEKQDPAADETGEIPDAPA